MCMYCGHIRQKLFFCNHNPAANVNLKIYRLVVYAFMLYVPTFSYTQLDMQLYAVN